MTENIPKILKKNLEVTFEKYSDKINKNKRGNIQLNELSEMVDSNKLKKIILEGSETNKVALRCKLKIALNILINLSKDNKDNEIELCYNKNMCSAYFIKGPKN